ncbi:MAG: integrin alpha, partial [Pseudomonadota bacterium]
MNSTTLSHAMATALAVTPLLWPTAGLGQTVDLGNLGDRGFRIEGASEYDQSGFSVSGAGDVNGDGLADLIIGAPEADGGGYSSGESFVVFGKADSGRVNLLTLQQNSNGFQIDGPGAADRAGISVSGAGDVNGDGLDDLIVGVYGGDPGGKYNAGETYVVFGKT